MSHNPNQGLVGGGRLVSEFADDPEMLELIRLFVEEIPSRVASLQSLWESRRIQDLRRAVHQLKGAGGGYGFGPLGAAAAQLESSIIRAETDSGEQALGRIQRELDDLIDMCRRVAA